MTHKADASFFARKRPWSERKDRILGYYLPAYMAKVAHLGRPVWIVDCFAGPGRFDDNSPGSPLIIREAIQSSLAKRTPLQAKALFIEASQPLYYRLLATMKDWPLGQCVHGTFLDNVARIEERARDSTVFLYIDPYTVSGLEWEGLSRATASVFDGQSVELLMNFNVDSFCRRGLAALALEAPLVLDEDEFQTGHADAAALDKVAGGNWWRDILASSSEYSIKWTRVTDEYCARLKSRFKEVCTHVVKGHSSHRSAKYVLVFASRSADALVLMNDSMIKSREIQAQSELPDTPVLFETRSLEVVPDVSGLPGLVMATARTCGGCTRRTLIQSVIRDKFGVYSQTAIRQCIASLCTCGDLEFESSTSKLNEDAIISVAK